MGWPGRRYDLRAAWSVDRLGRSLQDVVGAMQELRGAGVGLFLHQQALDTTTPCGRAMFGMLGVFAELEREIIVERQCVAASCKRRKKPLSYRQSGDAHGIRASKVEHAVKDLDGDGDLGDLCLVGVKA